MEPLKVQEPCGGLGSRVESTPRTPGGPTATPIITAPVYTSLIVAGGAVVSSFSLWLGVGQS